MNYLDNFSKLLKDLREREGLKQSELAEKLGVSRGSISFYENGDRVPDIVFLGKVSEFFNVSCDYLLGFNENPSKDIDDQSITEATGLSGLSVSILRQVHDYSNDLSTILNILIEQEFPVSSAWADTLEKYPSSFTKHRDTILKDLDREMIKVEEEAKFWPEQPDVDMQEQIRGVAKANIIQEWAMHYYQPILSHIYNYLVRWENVWGNGPDSLCEITPDGDIVSGLSGKESDIIKRLLDPNRKRGITLKTSEVIEYALLMEIQDDIRQLKAKRGGVLGEEFT